MIQVNDRVLRAYAERDAELTYEVMAKLLELDAFFEMYYYHGNGD